MTPNMLMVLLDVFRGTLDPARHLGTFVEDLEKLRRGGLIERAGGRWRTTPRGGARVQEAIQADPAARVAYLVWEDGCDKDGRPELVAVFGSRVAADAHVETEAEKWRESRPGWTLVKIPAGSFDHFELHGATHHPQQRPEAERRWTVQLLPLS